MPDTENIGTRKLAKTVGAGGGPGPLTESEPDRQGVASFGILPIVQTSSFLTSSNFAVPTVACSGASQPYQRQSNAV